MKAKLLRILFVIVIIASLLSIFPIPVSAQSIVDSDIGSVDGFQYAYMRHAFVANGSHFAFWEESNQMYYRSSVDGTTWTAAALIRDCDYGYQFSVWFDGTYGYYAAYHGTDLYFRRFTPLGNGTLSYSEAEQTIAIGSIYGRPNVCADTNGYPYIGYVYVNSATANNCRLIRASTNDGNWTTDAGYPIYGTIGGSPSLRYSLPIPLTGGKMVWFYSGYASYIRAKKYNGAAWGAEVSTYNDCTPAQTSMSGVSFVAQDDNVHISYVNGYGYPDYHLSYMEFMYSGVSPYIFTNLTNLQVPTLSTSLSTIMMDNSTNNLWVIWENYPTDNHLFVNAYDASVGSWSGTKDLLLEASGLPTDGYYLNSYYSVDTNALGIYYIAGTTTLQFKLMGEQFGVDTLTPTAILSTSAYLRGNITSIGWGTTSARGFIYKQGSDPLSGGATNLNEPGNFSTGVFGNNTGSALSPATHYHYRAYVSDGVTIYGNDTEFDTLGLATPTPVPTAAPLPTMPPSGNCTIAPDISTRPATYVSISTAQLNAYLNDDGDGETAIRFQYYTGAGTWTDNETAWIGGYWDGNRNAHAHISGLIGNTTYHFRAQAYNACGNDTGADLTFTTSITVGSITNFMAIPRVDTLAIDLQWAKPVGATEVIVRYKVGSYPGNTSDGILVCTTTMNAFAHLNLTAGETLWYSAWGKSGNNTSSTAAHAIATVTLSTSGTDTNVPGMPTNWFRDVEYTNLVDMPFYGIINWSADTFGIAREFFWMALGLIICVLVFLVAYTFTKGNLLVAALATLVMISVEVPMGLTAGFLAMLWAFPTGIIIFMKARE